MKIRFVFCFLVLISLVACNEKKNEIDPDLLLSVALLQPPDRAENYDRDVQIITHTQYTTDRAYRVGCDIDYSDADVNFVVERLKREIARYPRGYWIKAGAKNIVLCRNLTLSDNPQGGFASISSFIFLNVWDGIASYANQQVFNGSTNVNYFDYYYIGDPRRVISHELTHSVDLSSWLTVLFDPEWEGLNHPGFQYGNHNYNPQDTSINILSISNSIPGFVSYYATTNHLEDRAEIGMVIMGPQAVNNQLVRLCQNDPFVAAKVRKTVSRWKQFWPFPGAENTEWKARITQAERDCG
ncbi:LIC13305 family lipoprotein [Leptospira santarosai]|uniref:LIC13305 family lipoprotein n=1 Tax=Leptospira santarosai TaxID=28183 RepID=UPI0024AFEE1B|nr:hypothetical protein [Leptospira santarosai]MDI7210321.1 hypothetical protein [Leptospira santarosai]